VDAVYQIVSQWLGLQVEPKNLTFLQTSLRAAIVLIATLIMIRLGNKRSLSDRSAFDAVLLVILASVLSRAINGSATFFATIGAGFVLVLFHRFLAGLACAFPAFRCLIKGKAEEVVRDGKLIGAALQKHQISEADICEDLRLDAQLEDLSQIRVARLECNGDLSFIEKEA
jgi:uncharacterized membrane protein YcaP (DUF421 family)